MHRLIFSTFILVSSAAPALAQSWGERVAHLEGSQRERGVERTISEAEQRAILAHRLRTPIHVVDLEGLSARAAFQWWSDATGVSLVIDWRAMDEEGVSPDSPVTVQLEGATAGQVLAVLMRAVQADALDAETMVMFEAHPAWVEVTTRAQLNRRLVTRVYDVQDLVIDVPQFDDAPFLDLNQSLSNTRSGGSNAQGTQETRGTSSSGVGEASSTKQERGEALAALVQSTVQTEVWQANGGSATIQYMAGRLIVRAPMYVHRQIGLDEAAGSGGWSRPDASPTAAWAAPPPREARRDASAVERVERGSRVVNVGATSGVHREGSRTAGVANR